MHNLSGSTTKKRGIVIRSTSELNEISHLLTNQKLVELARNSDEANPKGEEGSTPSIPDIIEV